MNRLAKLIHSTGIDLVGGWFDLRISRVDDLIALNSSASDFRHDSSPFLRLVFSAID
jgi:hypothetical protein